MTNADIPVQVGPSRHRFPIFIVVRKSIGHAFNFLFTGLITFSLWKYYSMMHMAPTPEDHYPPEIIVLLSSNVPNPASNVFCDRIIRVEEHIPTTKGPNEKNDTRTPWLQAWDDNCGWTKLRLFGLEGAMTQYYIFMPIVWC